MPKQLPVFEIGAANYGDAYVVRIRGELDLTGQPALELALEEAERSRADRIVLELDELASITSWGLQTILGASRRTARNGNRLQITHGQGQVSRTFLLTALDQHLPLIDAALVPSARAAGS